MCDFMSWVEFTHGGKVVKRFWLDDYTIEAKWGDSTQDLNFFEQHIGHGAIEQVYGEIYPRKGNSENHLESWMEVPPVIAKEINNGNMDKMVEAWLNGKKAILRYTEDGKLKSINRVDLSEILSTGSKDAKAYPNKNTFAVGDIIVLGPHKVEVLSKCSLASEEDKLKSYMLCGVTSSGSSRGTSIRSSWASGYMEDFIGKTVKVESISESPDYSGELYMKVSGNPWFWHVNACRPATEDEKSEASTQTTASPTLNSLAEYIASLVAVPVAPVVPPKKRSHHKKVVK